jgi:hypothetical protein
MALWGRKVMKEDAEGVTAPRRDQADTVARIEALERRQDDLHDYVRRTMARVEKRAQRAEEAEGRVAAASPEADEEATHPAIAARRARLQRG